MKKITVDQALKLLGENKPVKAKISSRDVILVRTTSKLDDLVNLNREGVQDLQLFSVDVNKNLPNDCIEVSLDEAIQLIYEGESEIYGKTEDGDEKLENTQALLKYYRTIMLSGEPCIYWKG